MRSLAILLGLTAIAGAKPLPKGLTIGVAKKQLIATRDGVSVPLADDGRAEIQSIKKAALTDKGDEIEVYAAGDCGDGSDATTFTLSAVEAKLDNASGMGFHLKKQYDKAIPLFASAVAKDPKPIYVTNLLSAQSLGGKLDDADKTVATFGPKSPGWLAWRVAVDSDLAPIKGRPSVKPYVVAKPGSVKSGSLVAAYSPVGLVAIENSEIYEGIGSGIDAFLDVVDTTSKITLFRLPVGSTCPMMDPEHPDKACERKQKAAAVQLQKKADAVLAQLGFVALPATQAKSMNDGDRTITAPDGRKLVVPDAQSGESAKLTIGKVTKDAEVDWKSTAAFIPKALVVTTRQKNRYNCNDGLYYWTVDIVPTP